MLIQKDTWHYKLWRFSYYFHGDGKKWGKYENLPTHTNLCQYIRRATLGAMLVCLGFLALFLVCATIFVVINLVSILAGVGYLKWSSEKENDDLLRHFTPVTVGARQIPRPMIVLSVYAFLAALAGCYIFADEVAVAAGYGVYAIAGVVALATLLALVGLLFAKIRKMQWDGWTLFKAYLKAKKQGVCPIITFDAPGDPTASTQQGGPEPA